MVSLRNPEDSGMSSGILVVRLTTCSINTRPHHYLHPYLSLSGKESGHQLKNLETIPRYMAISHHHTHTVIHVVNRTGTWVCLYCSVIVSSMYVMRAVSATPRYRV